MPTLTMTVEFIFPDINTGCSPDSLLPDLLGARLGGQHARPVRDHHPLSLPGNLESFKTFINLRRMTSILNTMIISP